MYTLMKMLHRALCPWKREERKLPKVRIIDR